MSRRSSAILAAATASLVACSASWLPGWLRDPKGPVMCSPETCTGECIGGVCGAAIDTENQHPFGAKPRPEDGG